MGVINKIILVVAVSLLLLLIFFVRALDQESQQLSDARQKNTTLTISNEAFSTTIAELKKAASQNQQRLTQQHAIQQRIQAQLNEREALIEELQHDNAHIQSWADTALPDAIIRLRQRRQNSTSAANPDHPNPAVPDSSTLLTTSSQSND